MAPRTTSLPARLAAITAALGASIALAAPTQAAPDREEIDANPTTGWETYGSLDRLPYLNQGTNTLQSSSYDRTGDRKSTRLNSSHVAISYAVFCLKKKKYKK